MKNKIPKDQLKEMEKKRREALYKELKKKKRKKMSDEIYHNQERQKIQKNLESLSQKSRQIAQKSKKRSEERSFSYFNSAHGYERYLSPRASNLRLLQQENENQNNHESTLFSSLDGNSFPTGRDFATVDLGSSIKHPIGEMNFEKTDDLAENESYMSDMTREERDKVAEASFKIALARERKLQRRREWEKQMENERKRQEYLKKKIRIQEAEEEQRKIIRRHTKKHQKKESSIDHMEYLPSSGKIAYLRGGDKCVTRSIKSLEENDKFDAASAASLRELAKSSQRESLSTFDDEYDDSRENQSYNNFEREKFSNELNDDDMGILSEDSSEEPVEKIDTNSYLEHDNLEIDTSEKQFRKINSSPAESENHSANTASQIPHLNIKTNSNTQDQGNKTWKEYQENEIGEKYNETKTDQDKRYNYQELFEIIERKRMELLNNIEEKRKNLEESSDSLKEEEIKVNELEEEKKKIQDNERKLSEASENSEKNEKKNNHEDNREFNRESSDHTKNNKNNEREENESKTQSIPVPNNHSFKELNPNGSSAVLNSEHSITEYSDTEYDIVSTNTATGGTNGITRQGLYDHSGFLAKFTKEGKGKPHYRFFKLSSIRQELIWGQHEAAKKWARVIPYKVHKGADVSNNRLLKAFRLFEDSKTEKNRTASLKDLYGDPQEYCMTIDCKTVQPSGRGKAKKICLTAKTKQECNSWVSAIQEFINVHSEKKQSAV
eukprot:gb/GECH01006869.1/.p1 GENE.gb/GECH01006869.1/~~gb/GECH01006869.1/.p1  ORF type:complete len:724 (+),score=199.52 gb/GECH01006869.1/:1-2172(+)